MGPDYSALAGFLPGPDEDRVFSPREVFGLWLSFGARAFDTWPEAALQFYREGIWLRVGVDILARRDCQPVELECELPAPGLSPGPRVLVPRIVFPPLH